MFFRQIVEPKLAQNAYLIGCQRTGEALVVDPQRDIDRYLDLAAEEGLRIVAATETHIHADFLSGCRELAHRVGVTVYLSNEGDADWKYRWPEIGADRIRLLEHGDRIEVGNIVLEVVHTPGHTPEHLSFLVTDVGGGADEPMGMLTGDFVFVADVGRPDLLESAAGHVGNMEPSARNLYRSLRQFLELPDYLQVWPGHGAGSACGKALGAVPDSTVGYERRFNPSIAAVSSGEDAFVAAILDGQPEPPLYFSRMKVQNKTGPAILNQVPQPSELSVSELQAAAVASETIILDTRRSRTAFMAGHLVGSLYAPLDKSFPTIAGSFVDASSRICLIAEPGEVAAAVRDLIRIGLDDILGYATEETLRKALPKAAAEPIEIIDFAAARRLSEQSNTMFLDVRRRAEFERGHFPDARNIAHTRLAAEVATLEGQRRYLVHCLSGARAACSAALLQRMGHEVMLIDDGFRVELVSEEQLAGGVDISESEARAQ